MPPMYYFAHAIGHFVFDENFAVVDNGTEKLSRKYPGLIEINEQNIIAYKKVLLALKSQHYHNMLYEQNITATKKALLSIANNDNFIIHALASIDDIAKVKDIFMHRLGEWCSLFNPDITKSKELFSLALTADAKDAEPLNNLSEYVNHLLKLHDKQFTYLKRVMDIHCPNIAAVAGYELGARLIWIAGSLEKLSKMVSSQIQLLGAEKAFFRHLQHNTLLPKHGVIALHPAVKKATDEKKGKVARTIAEKLSIAAKVDYFKGEYIGDKLRKDIDAA